MGGNVKFITDPRDPALQQFGMYKGVQDTFFGGPRKSEKEVVETLLGGLTKPPPQTDMADLAARAAGLAERNKQLTNRGRRGSFLSGDLGPAPIEVKTLLGQ